MAAMSIPTPIRRIDTWAAGLCDAAFALRAQTQGGDSDIVQALEIFEGRQRALFDDLSEQVLRPLPAPIQAFLRQTAVLGRFSADLCDAVLGLETFRSVNRYSASSRPILEQLEEANLFLIALDDRRHWYRYSQRFADFLRAGLSQAEQQTLHRRASAWFEAQGLLPEQLSMR
jgi:LuxR family maltose regulon positive regulatory protein